jgi:hypothetical protein
MVKCHMQEGNKGQLPSSLDLTTNVRSWGLTLERARAISKQCQQGSGKKFVIAMYHQWKVGPSVLTTETETQYSQYW